MKFLEPNFDMTFNKVNDLTTEVIIEPLPQNFGHTIGNSLRRVLLNSLPGGAAIRVKVSGASHQFTTVKGVQEDVLEFVLNLKEVRFTLENEKEAKVKLSVTGKKTVTAKDLDLPAGVTVADPSKVLAHLTDAKSKLSATITVATGIGYVAASEFAVDERGVIPLDASFSPIQNVTYSIESTRVGRRIDFDRVRMTITTDGSITAKDAVKGAAEILTDFFKFLQNPVRKVEVKEVSPASKIPDGFIEDLELPTRVTNALKKGGYEELSDLNSVTLTDLKQVKNLGEKSIDEIVKKAAEKEIIIEK